MRVIPVEDSLKSVRKEHNFKQKEIAQALGIDRSTYSFYETGKTKPPLETIFALSKIYNVSIGYLLGREQNNPELSKGADIVAANVDPIAFLDKNEQLILMYYRLADDEKKKELEKLIGKKEEKPT